MVGDTGLVAALAVDLERSFDQLVRAYQDRLYAFALRWTSNAQDAEEIAQDAFVRAYQALRRYSPERIRLLALKPWLYQIALNVARNRARRKRPRLVSLDGVNEEETAGSGLEPLAAPGPLPEVVVERAEQSAELALLVRALPERYRVAVLLRHVEGLTYPELAAALRLPVGTVKAHVHRGVRLLRAALAAAAERELVTSSRGITDE